MFTSIFALVILLVVSGTTTTTTGCVVEWDEENVVATQLEGSWAINRELTQVLVPWYDLDEIDEIK